jgi:ABC-type phosphate transport system substrate-binding protein
MPVAQTAVAVLVNLPANCKATSTAAEGRLAITPASLQGILAGTIKYWSELAESGDQLTGSGCEPHTRINPIVPAAATGTAHILKRYLDWANPSPVVTEAETAKTWNELAENALSTTWPKAATVTKATNELSKVAETPSSIGVAALADARASGLFSGSGGGPGASRFWAVVKSAKEAYKDPSTNGDSAATAEANCMKTVYTNHDAEEPYPPPTVFAAWNAVGAAATSATYPLCGFVYMLTLRPYGAFSGATVGEKETVKNYTEFVLAGAGGQAVLLKRDLSKVPSGTLIEDLEGLQTVTF